MMFVRDNQGTVLATLREFETFMLSILCFKNIFLVRSVQIKMASTVEVVHLDSGFAA